MQKKIWQDRLFYRTLLLLAMPIIIQNLVISSLNMLDTLMIGAVGENEVAALGIANQYYYLFNLICTGAAAGCSVFIAQFWGSRNKEQIRKVLGVGMISAFFLGLVFTLLALLWPEKIVILFRNDPQVIPLAVTYLRIVCLSYIMTGFSFVFANALRSMGKASLPMIISVMALGVNAFFNYIFIFGHLGLPAMGVGGAALATCMARALEFVLLSWACFSKKGPFCGKWKDFFSFSWSFVRRIYAAVLPVILNEGCWGLGFVLYTVAYGKISTGAISASQIANSIQNLFMVVCFSLASASLVMVGNQIGAGLPKRAIRYAHYFTIISLLLGLILGIIVFAAAPFLLTFFEVSAEVAQATVNMLRIFAFIAPIRVLNVVLVVGVFRGGGDASYALKLEASTMWLIGVPLAFLGAMVFHLPVEQVVLLTTIEEIIKFCFCMRRLKNRKWVHDMTGHFKIAHSAAE